MKTTLLITLAFSILILQACGGPKYGCSYGEGVSCESVSTVYKDSLSGELERKKEEERKLTRNATHHCWQLFLHTVHQA